MVAQQPHVLLVTFPAQGHLNPSLQFAKRLIRLGCQVTLATAVSAQRRMAKTSFPEGLSFATFSDGYDDGFKPDSEPSQYMTEIRRRGSQAVSDLIVASANEGNPFTCLVHTLLLPWAMDVAREHHLRSTLLWIQPATVLDIYYYFFNGYGELFNKCSDPSYALELPGLPINFTNRDLPSFVVPSNAYPFVLQTFREQMDSLRQESRPKILVNTFDELETEALKAVDKFNVVGIGPLIPSAFLDGKDPSDTCFGADLFQAGSNKDYVEWLDSQAKSSVVYVSFGTIAVISRRQKEEIRRGLLSNGRPFLWVIRKEQKGGKEEKGGEEELEDVMRWRKELEKMGRIVEWCSQVEVLSHPSVGCFVTHCGWNSTLESLSTGVPVVAFPQWTDQGTNAKMIEEVWKTGVRVVDVKKELEEGGVVEGEEIKRCLDLAMGEGEKGEEIRRNARAWKDVARGAVREGGSSDTNLRAFVDEMR